MSLFPNEHSFCSQNTKSNEEDSQVNTIKAGPKDALQLKLQSGRPVDSVWFMEKLHLVRECFDRQYNGIDVMTDLQCKLFHTIVFSMTYFLHWSLQILQ